MNHIGEYFCVFLGLVMVLFFIGWFRYIQADGNIPCMFDRNPRICSMLERNLK